MNASAGDRVTSAVATELRAVLSRSDVEEDVNIGQLTTYRVGGIASVFVHANTFDDLQALASTAKRFGVEVAVIGRGSNLLVSDRGFDGLVVQLGDDFSGVDTSEAPKVVLGGAASLPTAARQTVAAGLTGFEWAVGVPGSAGGAVRMNAGGHGADMAESVTSARILNLRTAEVDDRDSASLAFGYRTSSVGSEEVVCFVEVLLSGGSRSDSEAQLAEIVAWRRENQPGGQNAGSVFTNPEGDSAGRLIDESGLKGYRVGTAEISTKHANFIQSDQGGTAADVFELMVAVRDRVRTELGITLEPETRFLGFGADDIERLKA